MERTVWLPVTSWEEEAFWKMRQPQRTPHLGRWAAGPTGAPGDWRPCPRPEGCCQTAPGQTSAHREVRKTRFPGPLSPPPKRGLGRERYRDILLRAVKERRRLVGHFIQAGVQGAVCKERGVRGAAQPTAAPHPSLARPSQTHRPPTEKRDNRGTRAPPSSTPEQLAGPSVSSLPHPGNARRAPLRPPPAARSESDPAFPLWPPLPSCVSQTHGLPTALCPLPVASLRRPQSSGLSRLSVKKRVGSAISLRSISSAIFPPTPQP